MELNTPDRDFSHMHVTFFTKPVKQEAASKKTERPVYKDVDFIKIQCAGDKHSVHTAPVHDWSSMHDAVTKQRLTYAQVHDGAYKAFKEKQNYEAGTPLENLAALTPAKIKTLKDAHIHTIEALAGVDGPALKDLGMHARDWKDAATLYLTGASKDDELAAKTSEIEDLKRQMAELQQQMAAQNSGGQMKPSPFESWKDEDIRNWIKDVGGELPHHKAGHAKVVAAADAVNAKIEKDKKDAA